MEGFDEFKNILVGPSEKPLWNVKKLILVRMLLIWLKILQSQLQLLSKYCR